MQRAYATIITNNVGLGSKAVPLSLSPHLHWPEQEQMHPLQDPKLNGNTGSLLKCCREGQDDNKGVIRPTAGSQVQNPVWDTGCPVDQCPGAAELPHTRLLFSTTTNLVAENSRKGSSYSSGGTKSEVKVLADPRGWPFLVSWNFWGLQVLLACGCITLISVSA